MSLLSKHRERKQQMKLPVQKRDTKYLTFDEALGLIRELNAIRMFRWLSPEEQNRYSDLIDRIHHR